MAVSNQAMRKLDLTVSATVFDCVNLAITRPVDGNRRIPKFRTEDLSDAQTRIPLHRIPVIRIRTCSTSVLLQAYCLIEPGWQTDSAAFVGVLNHPHLWRSLHDRYLFDITWTYSFRGSGGL